MYPRIFNPSGLSGLLEASIDQQTAINGVARTLRTALAESEDIKAVSCRGCDTLICVTDDGQRLRVKIEPDR